MSFLLALVTGICLSACTGFRAFVPLLVVGCVHRCLPTWVPLDADFAMLSQTPVLLALLVATMVETIADKTPWLDHALDLISIPIKMGAAALLVFLFVGPQDAVWVLKLLTMAVGTGTALTVHSAKAGVRIGSTTTTGGLLNPFISILEEIATLIGTLLTLFLPLVAGILLIWLFWRCFRFLFGKSGGNEGKIAQTTPSRFWYRLTQNSVWLYIRLYHRFSLQGTEHLPDEGPYVVVANHASLLDGFILGTCNKPLVYIMVKKEAFENPIGGWFLRRVCAFPVDRTNPDATSLRYAIRVLQQNQVLGLFPEGTRNRQGLVRPFKPGAIRLALKFKCPIVPAFLANTKHITPDGCLFPRPVPLFMKFGEPLDTKKLLAEGMKEEQMLDILYKRVCNLGQELTGSDVRDFSPEQDSPVPPPPPAPGNTPA